MHRPSHVMLALAVALIGCAGRNAAGDEPLLECPMQPDCGEILHQSSGLLGEESIPVQLSDFEDPAALTCFLERLESGDPGRVEIVVNDGMIYTVRSVYLLGDGTAIVDGGSGGDLGDHVGFGPARFEVLEVPPDCGSDLVCIVEGWMGAEIDESRCR
jgi:predicted heme/steroid binding protein